jgi:hypothetical protein
LAAACATRSSVLEDFAEVDFFIEQSKPELSAANYNVLKAAFNQKYSELESNLEALTQA